MLTFNPAGYAGREDAPGKEREVEEPASASATSTLVTERGHARGSSHCLFISFHTPDGLELTIDQAGFELTEASPASAFRVGGIKDEPPKYTTAFLIPIFKV